MLEEQVKKLYELEKKYWRHKTAVETLSRKIAACTNPVVSMPSEDKAYLLTVAETTPWRGKSTDVPSIKVVEIDHGRLVSFVVKEFVLGDQYMKDLAARDKLAPLRWELFKETVTLAAKVPEESKWPKPTDLTDTRVLEYSMRLVYKPIRVGFTKKPRLVWCFDGFDY